MATVTRRPRARQDLLEIWTRVAEHDLGAADRLLARLDQALATLADAHLRAALGPS